MTTTPSSELFAAIRAALADDTEIALSTDPEVRDRIITRAAVIAAVVAAEHYRPAAPEDGP
ncbi:hypothetical protein [Actinomycetospora cinnamomea]|uniref:Uncharacterized protein n=1 Tax=Actinomycetospora cinnamomea TaxID=663609 RepID=A0A2U1FM67_9PSEU|nr:hypothetical protein [Actinomycetospora cinnamomea]PVZ13140.1 hypothetical protein C8D89_102290 [Actinomycetospora cinnamomea]